MTQEARSTKTVLIDRPQRIQIAGASLCDERSIAAVYAGRPVKSSTLARVLKAARELGLPLPPTK